MSEEKKKIIAYEVWRHGHTWSKRIGTWATKEEAEKYVTWCEGDPVDYSESITPVYEGKSHDR